MGLSCKEEEEDATVEDEKKKDEDEEELAGERMEQEAADSEGGLSDKSAVKEECKLSGSDNTP